MCKISPSCVIEPTSYSSESITLARAKPLGIRTDVQDIAILRDITFPFELELARISHRTLAAKREQIRTRHALRANEMLRQIRVNAPRTLLRRRPILHRPGANFVFANRKERYQIEHRIRRANKPLTRRRRNAQIGQEIRLIFKASGVGNIAGSYVLDGVMERGCRVRISREGNQIFEGDLASLKRFKDDVKEVKTGFECGLVFDGFNDIQEFDQVEAWGY